jgi:hypothetical protein
MSARPVENARDKRIIWKSPSLFLLSSFGSFPSQSLGRLSLSISSLCVAGIAFLEADGKGGGVEPYKMTAKKVGLSLKFPLRSFSSLGQGKSFIFYFA